jgi:hypothetical protein
MGILVLEPEQVGYLIEYPMFYFFTIRGQFSRCDGKTVLFGEFYTGISFTL